MTTGCTAQFSGESLHHHKLGGLDGNASRQLFRQAAGLDCAPRAALLEFEAQILKTCGGMPLALQLMGGQLIDAEKVESEAEQTKIWQVLLVLDVCLLQLLLATCWVMPKGAFTAQHTCQLDSNWVG